MDPGVHFVLDVKFDSPFSKILPLLEKQSLLFDPTKNQNVDLKIMSYGSQQRLTLLCTKSHCEFGYRYEWKSSGAYALKYKIVSLGSNKKRGL